MQLSGLGPGMTTVLNSGRGERDLSRQKFDLIGRIKFNENDKLFIFLGASACPRLFIV